MRQAQRHYSVEEYFGIEEMSEVRHEFFDGEIFAMSGGSTNHNQIAQNLTRTFDALRDRGCRSYLTDIRLRTPAGLYTYPDVLVICGSPTYTSDRMPTVTNPVVVAEVLSRSTRDYDRGQKFELYRGIATLRDYMLIEPYTIDVEHRFPAGTRWESKRYTNRRSVFKLTGADASLRVDALYDLVDFSSTRHDH